MKDKSQWYDDEFETRDDFIRDFEKKGEAFIKEYIGGNWNYKTVTTPDKTVFLLFSLL